MIPTRKSDTGTKAQHTAEHSSPNHDTANGRPFGAAFGLDPHHYPGRSAKGQSDELLYTVKVRLQISRQADTCMFSLEVWQDIWLPSAPRIHMSISSKSRFRHGEDQH